MFATSNDSRIRVGLLGYGFAGKVFHAPLISTVPSLKLVAISSRDSEKVLSDYPDVRVLADASAIATADDIDLVVVATPNDSHAPLACAALEAGKNVVVDKPFTLNVKQARELVSLAERQGRMLSVFQNRRWDSDYLTIRRAIADNIIGSIVHFESHIDRYRPEVRDRWRDRDAPGSGVWFDLGPHLVDQALQVFGLPDRVVASLACQREGSVTNDWVHVVLEFGKRRAVLQAGLLAAGGSSRFIVHGEAGSLIKRHVDPQEAQVLSGMRPGDVGWGKDEDPLVIYGPDGKERMSEALAGDARAYYEKLSNALRGRADNPVCPYQAIAVMAVIEAAVAAARTGAAASLSLTDRERAVWHR